MKPNYRFLLIDDNVIDQIITKQLLKKALNVYDITVVNSGKEGIQWLQDNRNHFEELVMLLDIKMPEMDGFEFLLLYDVLSEELKSKTHIFMLSSTLDPHDINRAKSNKYVKSLLSKPLDVKEFGRMIYPDSSSKEIKSIL